MCEGSADVPYMQALCKHMTTTPTLSFSTLPRIDHATGGAQWKIVEAAANKLRSISEKSSRSLVIIDSDRGNAASSETERAKAIAEKFPPRFGVIKIVFVEPCFEGFILSICGCKVAVEDSLECKKQLEKYRLRMGVNVFSHETLLPLFRGLCTVKVNFQLAEILAWLRKE